MEIVESKYPKGTPMESYKKILRVIVSITPNVNLSVIDNQFSSVDRLIDRFNKLYSDILEVDKLIGFLRVSKHLRYKQVTKEIDERH